VGWWAREAMLVAVITSDQQSRDDATGPMHS
jgi:hypothetical protein